MIGCTDNMMIGKALIKINKLLVEYYFPNLFYCYITSVYIAKKHYLSSAFKFLLRGQDLNLQPPGYEPDELPIALPRGI
jgi:hypothetical protein